jgi:2-polyprenyl-3-methyl-5-hydroxy-6-metoxy-1,4-benzoquinol methylase
VHRDNRDTYVRVKDLSGKTKRIRDAVKVFRKYVDCGRVLDVGTRDGFCVELLTSFGYDASGIELMLSYVNYARDMGRNVCFGDMMDVNTLPSGGYDAVFSRHCIEHCRDPRQFFKSCKYVLRPGGKLFIIAPLQTRKEFKRSLYHLSYFHDKKSFLGFVESEDIKTIVCDFSYKFGIRKDKKKELLFIGECH